MRRLTALSVSTCVLLAAAATLSASGDWDTEPSPVLAVASGGFGADGGAPLDANSPSVAQDAVQHPTASDRVEAPREPVQATATHTTVTEAIDVGEVIQGTCVRCHSDRRLRGNLTLEDFDASNIPGQADIAERMIRKLRAGMMPPPGTRAPGGDTLAVLTATLEETLDRAYARAPDPGVRTFQRLNRAEYERAVEDLLGLQVDAGDWLPLDQMSANFDNIGDVQALSPTLLESYLNAAADISRLAMGDRDASSVTVTYKNSEYVSQHSWDHIEGAPYGTRGGLVVEHTFPADAEYVFEMSFASAPDAPFEDIDISIDGERVAVLPYVRAGAGADGRGATPLRTEPILIRAGQHRLSAAFVKRADGPYEDLIRPHVWAMAGGGDGGAGVTALPHMKTLAVEGPYNATGVSETDSRRRIFSCRPTAPSEERACATEIISNLATRAYRRLATDADLTGLLTFFDEGDAKGGFEMGIRTALEAVLASPHFVLRLEREPTGVRPGTIYTIEADDLASRLSFFLWGAPPDAELLEVAASGELTNERVLEQQARRMLADERAEALGSRFAAQWLRLQDLYKVRPDPNFYPDFDENLADLMHRETELFFNNIVRENGSVLQLLTADYTYLNERLARHYGIPGVSGGHFRRVDYPTEDRRGLLGQGSVLVLTSLANRTSPVLRGKWVMEVLLGTPPPPPPPGVPDLEETEGSVDGRMLTTRERMEMHRANPQCNSCHRFMDPIGLALDNYDVTGRWRVRENGMSLDTRGDFYDGTPVTRPGELSTALLNRPLPLVRTFTENLMAYALGRRVEYTDQPAVRAIVRDAEAQEYGVESLIMGVVMSDAFRMKRAAAAVTAEEATNEGQ